MLDPDLAAAIAEIRARPALPPPSRETLWRYRAAQYRDTVFGPAYEEVAEVRDLAVEGRDGPIRVKRLTPRGLAGDAPAPALLRIHGGGMVLGSPEYHEHSSRILANALGARVFDVAYRLAPEHPWPAGLHDCVDALRWLHAEAPALGVDRDRIAVLGHSAGALLALCSAIALRGEGPRVRRWIALEPPTGPGGDTASWQEFGDGSYLLGKDELALCWSLYLDGAEPTSPTQAPALASEDDLRGLDPVAILTMECDPLRDEGEALADRLAAAGVDVERRRFDGLAHGSIDFLGRVPATQAVHDEIVRLLRAAFAARPAHARPLR